MSRIKDFFTGKLEFYIEGLPLSCLNKLRMYHITQIRTKENVVCFQAPLVHGTTIKKLVNNFEYHVTENYNFFRGINFLLNHLILVLSILTAAIVYMVADMRIYQVRIQCDDINLIPGIYKHLDQLGVKKFMWKKHLRDFDLASDLVGSFDDIAHAHVRIVGNTLVVNLVSATNQTRKIKTNFYAQYDAVIKEITAYSGTALVTVGDVVKKGDLLVTNAYPDSVVVTGEVAFVNGEEISRLVIWII